MGQPVPVSVVALDPMLEAGAVSALESSPDVEVVARTGPSRVTVVLVGRLGHPELELIRTVRDAVERPEVVIVATELAARETLYAIAAGARGLLRRREASADRLVRAVLTADMGDCTLPPDIFENVVAQGASAAPMVHPHRTDTVDQAIDACRRGGTVAVLERPRVELAAQARVSLDRMPYPNLMRMLSAATKKQIPLPRPSVAMPLTARQTSVLRLMADGHGNGEIARMLSCSEHTVKNAIYDLMARLQVRNRAQAVASAIRTGLI
jgi:DNA-binding NarL/FixJ family response regulator